MHGMMAALNKKRMDKYAGNPGVKEETANPGGEMSDYWRKIQAMDAKLDQILSLISAESAEPAVE